MYRNIIFDFGNTLASSASLANSLEAVLGDPVGQIIGLEIEQAIASLYHSGQVHQPDWYYIWSKCFAVHDYAFSRAIGYQHLQHFAASNNTYVDSKPLLRELKARGLRLGLLSNVTGPFEIFDRDLKQRGLAEYFDTVTWSSQIGFRKPSAQSFLQVLNELNADPNETLMVGDSEVADIQGANAIGLHTALVSEDRSTLTEAHYRVRKSHIYEDLLTIIFSTDS